MVVQKRLPKILMLYDFPIEGGGSGVYVKHLALRLSQEYKYQIAIAAPDVHPVSPEIQHFYLKLPQIPVYVSRPGLEKEKKYSQLTSNEIADLYYAFIKETIRVVEAFKPDIIHVHHAFINSWAARFIRSIYGIKFIVTSHGSCLQTIATDRRYLRLTRDALWAASAITVVSGDTRAKLSKLFGKDISLTTRTIPGGARMSLFPKKMPEKKLATFAEKFQLPKERIVLFTGRLINEKGVKYLIKAAKRIHAYIVIAGDGPQKERLAELIREEKLVNIKLVGFIEHAYLIDLYYLADVFVSPSVWDDPMPLSIIEAMAAGLPVVVTRKGGIPIAVKDGYNGFFVKPRNATDIAEKVNKLLDNEELRQKMGERARRVVSEKFTWTQIAKRFHDVYSKL